MHALDDSLCAPSASDSRSVSIDATAIAYLQALGIMVLPKKWRSEEVACEEKGVEREACRRGEEYAGLRIDLLSQSLTKSR